MKILEKFNELFPREWQDKVMTAYVGRLLSGDIPQLIRNVRYGMRADPAVGRMEYAALDWDDVEQERLNHMSISEIAEEGREIALKKRPLFRIFRSITEASAWETGRRCSKVCRKACINGKTF